TNNAVQVIDADGSNLVVTDQTLNTVNFGLGFANSGFNFAVGNYSDNDNESPPASAIAISPGPGDAVAFNDATNSNSSNGSALIATGNANGVGNTATNNNSQVLNADGVSAMRRATNSTLPLMLLMLFGLLFIGTPIRRLGLRRR
ncbi:MAG: hypothetical protein QOF21_2017, partial [Actinomycetota bacterium]